MVGSKIGRVSAFLFSSFFGLLQRRMNTYGLKKERKESQRPPSLELFSEGVTAIQYST